VPPGLPPEAEGHYRVYAEADRLRRHGLERVRTEALLRPLLPPPPARVLDVGGGTGVHADWLADAGHEVHLLDAMPEHVEQARALAAGRFTAEVGDAKALDQADESFDVVLLLGPLYHLVQPEDRAQALAEALRVLRPGGLLAAGAVCRVASLLDGVASRFLDEPAFQQIVRQDLATGQHRNPTGDPRWFTTTFFHAPEELADEVTSAGFELDRVMGVEGPGWIVGEPECSLVAAELADQHPELTSLSAHLLALARKL
jgi:ubiquinone/menaquinone biosynthesis C-methylase UbiE